MCIESLQCMSGILDTCLVSVKRLAIEKLCTCDAELFSSDRRWGKCFGNGWRKKQHSEETKSIVSHFIQIIASEVFELSLTDGVEGLLWFATWYNVKTSDSHCKIRLSWSSGRCYLYLKKCSVFDLHLKWQQMDIKVYWHSQALKQSIFYLLWIFFWEVKLSSHLMVMHVSMSLYANYSGNLLLSGRSSDVDNARYVGISGIC